MMDESIYSPEKGLCIKAHDYGSITESTVKPVLPNFCN